ncbi:MAG: Ig-like domain-containing protein, partial [Patescibacteria group bacterium]
MHCSANCLHKGTILSNKWCSDNNPGVDSYGGFTSSSFRSACKNAISRCGDGIVSLDEDSGCDLGGGVKASWCNNFCLANTSTHFDAGYVVGAEGYDENRQHIGSSLLYTTPSLCGDGISGIGEDNFCEDVTTFSNTRTGVNPWSLVTGIGMGPATGVPPSQQTDINANITQETAGGVAVGDKGQFIISCGYKTDAECQARAPIGSDWGVAANGCCYERPKLLSVYPGNTSTAQFNVCPNTAIEASFDQEIDLSSLKNNIVLARGLGVTSSAAICSGAEDVTSLATSASTPNYNNLPWYKKIFVAVVNFFKNLAGQNAAAVRAEIQSVKWCAGEDLGQADVAVTNSTSAKIIFKLTKPLAFDTDYFVALKDGLRNKQGVSIGTKITGKPFSWKFITGSKMCEIDRVAVDPAQVYLNKVGATSTITAHAYNVNATKVQSIPGYYAWEYLWQPAVNPYVNLSASTSSLNIISAQNRNGEIDLRASAVITDNIYSGQFGLVATGKSHVIVFLCENPWPPKDLYLGGVGPYVIFPYEDKVGNNDGYNLSADTFDNTSIPPSPSGGYFNFRSYYCADAGSFGIADDLPYLRPAVQVSSAIVAYSPTSSLKRFIFT